MATVAVSQQFIPKSGLTELVTEVMAGREYLARLDVPLSSEHFLGAIEPLPDPCPEQQAAQAIVRVLREHGYAGLLLPELDAGWERRWPSSDTAGSGQRTQQDADEWMPLCGWCGEPCSDQRARYCRPAHRNAAWKRRRREKRRGDGSLPGSVISSP